jgi:hypothetical protein
VDALAGREHVELHRTAESLERSLGRWQREGLPAGVAEFMNICLEDALRELGYDAPVSQQTGPLPSIRFGQHPGGPATPEHAPRGSLLPDPEGGLSVTGADAGCWINLSLDPVEAAAVREVWLSVRATTGRQCSLCWRGNHQDFSADRCVHAAYHPSKHWRVLRFPVGRHEHWRGSITQLQLHLFQGASPRAGPHGCLRWLRLVA